MRDKTAGQSAGGTAKSEARESDLGSMGMEMAAASFSSGYEELAGKRGLSAGELGLRPMIPVREPSGFVRGGVNESLLIAELEELNGRPIGQIEEIMRREGLLGTRERLLECLQSDNDSVLEAGHDHQAIAWPVKLARAKSVELDKHMTIGDREYLVQPMMDGADTYNGIYDEPDSRRFIKVTDLESNADLIIWASLSELIEGWGFYGGTGALDGYRQSPRALIDFFRLEPGRKATGT